MGFTGKSAKAHATGAEALADALHTLHLLQGHRCWRQLELHQIAQSHHRTVLQQRLIRGEVVITRPLGHRLVQCLGQFRVVAVVFGATAIPHEADEFELAAIQFREGLGMHRESFISELRQRHACHAAGGAGEGRLDHIGSKTDGFKNLSTVVTGEQRYADLGKDLAQSVLKGDSNIGLNPFRIQGRQLALLDPFLGLGVLQPMAGGLPGEPGADRAGPVTDQAGDVVRAPALSGINNERTPQPKLLAQQVMVNGADGEQGRHCRRGGIELGGCP